MIVCLIMSELRQAKEPGEFPFRAEYYEFTDLLNNVQQGIDFGLYRQNSAAVQQLVRLNRDFLPNGKFFDRFADLLTRQQEPTEEELFDLGVDVGSSICLRPSPKERILGYLNTLLRLDALCVGMVGPESNRVGAIYSVINYARRQTAESLPLDGITNSVFTDVGQSLVQAGRVNPYNASIFKRSFDRLDILHKVWLRSKEFREYAISLFDADGSCSDEELCLADRGIDLLTRAAMKQRKYGTKPAYIESSAGGIWLFYDGDDWRTALMSKPGSVNIPPIAAVVMHAPECDIQTIDLSLDAVSIGKVGQVRRNQAGPMAANPDFGIIIQHSGSITLDYEGLQPLEVVMPDKPTTLRRLKAEIASNFYDLSMAIDASARPAPRNYAQMAPQERQGFNPITQLLIPRLRYMEDRTEPVREKSRIVRRHDVAWYVRPLPPGWHASPEAIKLAKEVGVELEPNETFVKKHKRGSGQEKIVGYHAVRRAIDLKPGDY